MTIEHAPKIADILIAELVECTVETDDLTGTAFQESVPVEIVEVEQESEIDRG